MRLFLFTLLLFPSFHLLAQTDSLLEVNEAKYWKQQDSIDQIKQDSIELAHKQSHLITVETNYTNKVVYRGRDFGLKQQGIFNTIKYQNPIGLYVNISNYYWTGIANKIAKTDLGIGFAKSLTSKIDFDISYEKWILANDTFFLGMNFSNMLQASINTNYDKFNVEAAVYYIFGIEKAFLYNLRGTYSIDLPTSSKNLYWNLTTGLLFEAYAGQKNKSDTTKFISNNTPFREIKSKYVLQSPQLANTELQLELNVEYKSFTLTPSLHYAYPLAINYEDVPLSSYLSNGYTYFTFNVVYNVYLKTKKIHGK